MLLRGAKAVSAEIPVPGLSSALEVALIIAEKAKACSFDHYIGRPLRLTTSRLGDQRHS